MRAIRFSSPGGPEVLTVEDVASPEPGAGQVRVAVDAAGVNFIDVYQRSGIYALPLPSGIGLEGAGTVSAVGAGVTDRAVGDRVAWAGALGSYAQELVLDADQTVALPAAVDTRTAAAVMLQGMTAHFLTTSTFALGAGHTALVWAAAGGVGRLLVQMAVATGAKVIACTSTDAKRAEVTRLGAHHVLDSRATDLAEQVRALTDGRGADVVYDSVGKDSFDTSLAAVARRGLLVNYGAASGPVPPLDVLRLMHQGSVFVTRPSLVDYLVTPEELALRAGAVLDLVARGALDVRIHAEYALADAGRAQADLASGTTSGKLLLLPGS